MLPVVEPTPPDAFLTDMRRVGSHELFVMAAPSFDVMCRSTRYDDSLKFIVPRRGSVRLEQDSRKLELQAGQVALLSLERPFRFQASAPKAEINDLVQWRFPRELVSRRHPGWHLGGLRAVGDGSSGERVLAGLLLAFAQNCSQLSPQETAASFAVLVEALGLLTAPGARSFEETRVQRALGAIHKGLCDSTLTPESVAAEQGVTRRYLDELFKRSQRKSVSTMIREARLHRAAEVLQTGSETKLLTLALSLGFENQSHFARCFKAQFGVSPSKFRKN